LMAIANRVLVHQFLIHPYPVQLLTVLALLSPNLPDRKGYLAQVKTGEGKSMILALTALTMACQGKCVDVITSTAHLAQRDQQKYANFFHWFDISSSCLAKSQLSQQEFAGQIVYGPNFQFEFSILFDDLCRKHYRALYSDPQQTRPFHVALVDEVDNMLVDKGTQSARIAYPTDDTLLPLYPKLYDYIATYASPDHPPGKALTDACRMLAEGFGVNEKKLNQLVESAYSACFHQQQNIHYRVQRSIISHNKFKQSNEIIIIDDNTGRLAQASRWQYGLHAFLEHKHQLPIQADTATIGSLSHPSFFACYPEIYGLTGTVGEDADRSEVSDIYNLGTFDMPTDKPRQLTRYDMQIAESEHHFNDLLVDELKQMQIKGRPCLLINSSVQQSQEMVARLKKAGLTANVQLLNDIQEETEEYVVDSAGKPGTITSATNAAGRGTDIPLSDESINNGGLHVIFTFFPANARVEEQGAGRAARQGQPGSYRILVPVTDPLLKAAQQYWFQKKKVMTTEHLINFLMESIRLESGVTPDIADLAAVRSTELCAFRTDRVTTLSQNRRQAARLGQIQYQLLTQFTAWYQTRLHDTRQSRHQLLSEWARCYDEIEMIQPEHTAQGLQFEENLTIYAAQAGALVSQFLQSCQQPDV